MSVKIALYRYLTSPGDLPGLPAKLFERPRTVNGLTCTNRNDARRWFRDRVGVAVFADRVPQGSHHAAVELRTISSDPAYATSGAVDGEQEYLSAFVYTKDGDASLRADTIARLINLAVSGYHGDYWDGTYIGECLVDTRQSLAISPADASDKWTHQVRLDLSILYVEEGTPVYAADELSAEIRTQVTADDLYLFADVTIPEGRTLSAVTWVVRQDDASGTLVITITGDPYSAVGAGNTSGTKLNPVIDLSSYGISGLTYIKLIVGDDSTTTFTTEVIIDG